MFELAGRDRHGLLAAVLQLLVVNGCEVLSAAVRACVLACAWVQGARAGLLRAGGPGGGALLMIPRRERSFATR